MRSSYTDHLTRPVEAVIAEERANQHHLVADRLSELITTMGSSGLRARDEAASRVTDLVLEVVPSRSLASLHLRSAVRSAVDEVIEEHRRSDLLRSHGLEPRNRILLDGPPGNGKTSLAEAIATETMMTALVPNWREIERSSTHSTRRLASGE